MHPFALSPFDRTLFLDDDTLLIRPIRTVIARHFAGRSLDLAVGVALVLLARHRRRTLALT